MNCLKCKHVKLGNDFVESEHSYEESVNCTYDRADDRWIGWRDTRIEVTAPRWCPISSKKPKYKKGDLLNVPLNEKKMLIHCCNNIGVMGAGIALSIRKKYPDVFEIYKKSGYKLGTVSFIDVKENLIIANMIGQDGVKYVNQEMPPIRYVAIDKCLQIVAQKCKEKAIKEVIAPKFGAGLAGGDWEYIEHMINKRLLREDIHVTIYEL